MDWFRWYHGTCGGAKLAGIARRRTTTGAVRDGTAGKGRFDLMPFAAVQAIARQMERHAQKYGERNWEKGMLLSWFLDSAERHLGMFKAGFDDEPHLDAALWNLACLAEGRERIRRGLWPAAFDDLPDACATRGTRETEPVRDEGGRR